MYGFDNNIGNFKQFHIPDTGSMPKGKIPPIRNDRKF